MARNLIRSVRALAGLALALMLTAPSDAQAERPRVTAHDLATLTDIDGLTVSPDGAWAAFQLRRPLPEPNTYDLTWYIAPTAGGVPRRLADGGLPVLHAFAWPRLVIGGIDVAPPLWSPDSQWIIYTRRDAAGTQLWRSRIDGGRTEQLTHNAADVGGYTISSDNRIVPNFRLSRDARRLYFQTRASEAQLAAALVEEGRTGYLFDDRFLPGVSLHPRAPRGASLQYGLSNTVQGGGPRGEALWVYDLTTRRERLATADETTEYAALVEATTKAPSGDNVQGNVVSSPGGSLAWTEARDPELQGAKPPATVVAQPRGAAAPTVCEARACSGQFVTVWRWRNDGELLLKAAAPDGSTRLDERTLYAWRPGRDNEPRLILRTTGLYDDLLWNCDQVHDKLICLYEDLNRPRRLVSIDLDSGAIETLYDPNPAWARFDLGASPRAILVRTESGFEMHSYLVLPPNYQPGERLPLVIVGYVCDGFLRGGVGDEYPIYPLAAQGFAVLCFNDQLRNWAAEARGPDPTPPEFSPTDGDRFRELVQAGLDAAIRELDRMGVIDPDRVGVTGLSAGAQMVEYAIIHRPRLAAAIESGTMFEAAGNIFCARGGCRSLRQAGFGSPTSERWITRAMSRNVERIRTPLLINASDQEMLRSVEPIRALRAADRAAELYVYPDEHHVKWQPAHRLSVYNRNIDWMNFWLRGAESGLTGDPEQYTRWRAMRESQCRLFGGGGVEAGVTARGQGTASKDAGVPWYCLPDAATTTGADPNP